MFQRYFYAFTLRYASLSCLLILRTFHVSLLGKEVGKTATETSALFRKTVKTLKKMTKRHRSRNVAMPFLRTEQLSQSKTNFGELFLYTFLRDFYHKKNQKYSVAQ